MVLLNCTQTTPDLAARLVDARPPQGRSVDLRVYGIGAQILRDLGISRIRLMTNNQRKYDGIADFGLQILERVPLTSTPHAENEAYLRTKQLLMGHTLGLAMQQ